MRLVLKQFLLIFLLTISKGIHAQIQDVNFNLLTGTNGVTLGKINNMVRDKYGFLWFSNQSNGCIIRFDGSHMTRYQYNPQNSNSLGGVYPECLATDSSGNIWIGFTGMGLDKFDPVANKFAHYRHNDKDPASLHNDVVSAVLIDHFGNIWVGNNSGLDLLDQKTGKFKHYGRKDNDPTSLSCDTVRALYEDKEGELWVGTGYPWTFDPNGGLDLFHRDNGTFTRYMHDPKDPHSLIANKVRAIFEDSYGNFWVGTNGDGLHTMDRRTGKFTRYIYDPSKPDQLSRTSLKSIWDNITFITEDADGKIWIGTLMNGLIRYDPVSKKVTHYGSDDDKKGLLKDKTSWWANASPDGFVWISTQTPNVFKADIYNTTIPFYGNTSFYPNVDNIIEDIQHSNISLEKIIGETRTGTKAFNVNDDSTLWIATDSGLIHKDLKHLTFRRYINEPHDPNSLSNDHAFSILNDTAGNFWIGTACGLNYFNSKKGSFTRYYPDSNNKASFSNIVMALCRGNNSNIWLGSYGGGLYLFNLLSHKFINYKYIPSDAGSISGNFISTLLMDGNNLWAGTNTNNGVNKFNPQTNKFSHYLPGVNISCIYKDADGAIWVGTEGGIYLYDRKLDAFAPPSKQNPANNIAQVAGVTGDKENNLWISSETGIYLLNKNRDHVIRFGREYGVPEANAFFSPGAAFTAQNGEVYFGKAFGYNTFFPEKLRISRGNPQLYFTGFWVNNKQILPDSTSILTKPLYQTKEIRLRHDQNVFAFSATSVDFRNAIDNRIYYKLDNYDADWRVAQPEDEMTYFKVPAGNHTFRIKTPGSGNESWIEKSINVIIMPPWWATWWAYCIYAILLFVLGLSVHRYQKARVIKAERERARVKELAQAKEIEKAYHELKTTQAQLIQSEKMASLGELTAGIAHEIQNPLNFVNNFSDVNTELIDEAGQEIDKGNIGEVKMILNDIKENEQKINLHGKRADSIVKGMLQHSRASSGQRELTDINKLADEYLRLSYYGLRAKEKSFNADFKTDFDESIGKINGVPQDIGRVLLNLFNNAFYTVNEKQKAESSKLNAESSPYVPKVTVVTKKLNNKIEIKVQDNGNGISQNIVDKIFQPFFTTKPTGQGTGLGLSLAYDIVKAHSGEIKVETKEGEGTTFNIQLPV
jgi:signal transduction histidine kinase/ligand-binding sensor domain-containing protein